MPTAQELANALTSDMRRVQDAVGLTPSAAHATRLSAALDRLEVGIDAANVKLQEESDAGRLATAQYRLLDTALNSSIMLRDRAEAALAEMSRGGVRTPGDFTNPEPTSQQPARRSVPGTVWILGGGIAALGAGWLVLKLLDKKKPVPAGGA